MLPDVTAIISTAMETLYPFVVVVPLTYGHELQPKEQVQLQAAEMNFLCRVGTHPNPTS